MKRYLPFGLTLFFMFLTISQLFARVIVVNSQATFDNALATVVAGDSIEWQNGTYADIFMEVGISDVIIKAAELGGVIFNGASRVVVTGNNVTIEGFQFVGGAIGTNHVIRTFGDYTTFTQLNVKDYECYKYLIVEDTSQYATISYCNFENRITVADQNILSILVDEMNPGYHKVQYCSFKNFPGGGNDEGVEPIRIGTSTQGGFDSRSLVEYCYFTQCDGDGELISNKASQNVYRYNTFEDNSMAELVLRHGSEVLVYGNFFLNGMGGVRIREGQNHAIFNNYFSGQTARSIFLQNEPSDPLDAIFIGYNTLVDTYTVLLAGSGANPPTNVTFANNIFSQPVVDLFDDPTGTETWIGNIADGSLGIPVPTGITVIGPKLQLNSEGYYELLSNSPAIDAAQSGYPVLPAIVDLPVDSDILFDIVQQARPELIAQKDVGCSEYPHTVAVAPIATEDNTGPSYETSSLGIDSDYLNAFETKAPRLFPNPIRNEINVVLQHDTTLNTEVLLIDVAGRKLKTLVFQRALLPGRHTITEDLSTLASGVYMIKINQQHPESNSKFNRTLKFIKE